MAPPAAEIPLRASSGTNKENRHQHRNHGADSQGSTKAAGRHGAPSSTAAGVVCNEPPSPQVIECRKKNSRGESVITHRYYKGRLLGKVGAAAVGGTAKNAKCAEKNRKPFACFFVMIVDMFCLTSSIICECRVSKGCGLWTCS